MPKKISQGDYEQRVRECVGDRFTVVSKYNGRRNLITLHCNIHNIDFSCLAECFMRGKKDIRATCPECLKQQIEKKNRKKRFK